MRRALRSRPSPAMVVALIALFVALGGSGYAAVKLNGNDIRNRTVPGKALKRNTVTGTEVRESRLGTVPRAQNAATVGGRGPGAFLAAGGTAADSSRLGGREPGSFLASGATAADSSKLGGLAPSSFVRRECDQESGQLKGAVTVEGSGTFSSTFVVVPGYNCSGGTIEARRLSDGRYEVRFNGSPATRAVATPHVTAVEAMEASILRGVPGVFTVHIVNPSPSPGAFVDRPFTLITP